MATRPVSSKREAILDATLALVVKRGFHDAPMSLIAKRAGASPGVIYHHFASKDAIIQALYERTRALKTHALLFEFDAWQEPGENFVKGFASFYHFYRRNQQAMRFYEQYRHSGFAVPSGKTAHEKEAGFLRRFRGKSQGGVLKDWPPGVLEEMTIGLIARLASQPRKLSETLLHEVAWATWVAIAAEK